jgi:hypothetical protein
VAVDAFQHCFLGFQSLCSGFSLGGARASFFTFGAILVKSLSILFYLFIYFCITGGLNSGPAPWATPPALFCDEFFRASVLWTICPG